MRSTGYSLLALLTFVGCQKDCGVEQAACKEVPQSDGICGAYFERWFYSPETGKCAMVSYSDCSPKGFATKEECDTCKCK